MKKVILQVIDDDDSIEVKCIDNNDAASLLQAISAITGLLFVNTIVLEDCVLKAKAMAETSAVLAVDVGIKDVIQQIKEGKIENVKVRKG